MATLRLTGGRTLDVDQAMADMLLRKKNDKKEEKGTLYNIGHEVYITLSEIRGFDMRDSNARHNFQNDKYNIDNEDERKIIYGFEIELGDRSFEQYLEDNGIFRKSKDYPLGAFNPEKLDQYALVKRKMAGLQEVRYRQEIGKRLDSERIESLVEQMTV